MQALELSGFTGPTVAVNQAALTQRDESLASAALIMVVGSPEQQSSAVAALQDLRGWCKQVETARKELKAPVLNLGRQIDDTADQFCQPVLSEVARINLLVTNYQVAERKKAEAAEAARLAELKRIEAERIAKEKAEFDRTNAELAKAKSEQASEAALKAEEERMRQIEAEAAKAKAQAMAAPVAAPPKAAGLVTQEVWVHEVMDLHALYAARPDLVTLEPKSREINTAIRAGLRECPGLVIRKEIRTGVRV